MNPDLDRLRKENPILSGSPRTIDESYEPDTANELYTANLIAVYQDGNLSMWLSEADKYELEKTILRRLGLRDA